jgi:hypothetical protein
MAEETVSSEAPIPEYVEINQVWHDHVDSIWPEAPDLKYYAIDYSIYLPDFPDAFDETISSPIIRVYFDHIKPRIDAFKETIKYKMRNISEFWLEQISDFPDTPPLELSDHNGKIVIDNRDIFIRLIEMNEDLTEPFDALVHKLKVLNHELPIDIPYDIILYINVHGATTLESEVQPEAPCVDDRVQIDMRTGKVVKIPGRIKLFTPPPPNQVTFLTATQLGIDNIKDGDEVKEIQIHILKTLEETQTLDIHKLQSWLQTQKKVKTTKGYVKRVGERLGIENVQQYARSVGWRIAHNYVNRRYEPDPKWNPKIAIIYVKPETALQLETSDLFERIMAATGRSSMTTKSHRLRPYIHRTELLTYLYELGYTHPLIIDSSCGGFYTRNLPTGREARSMQHTAKLGEGAAGGTRKYNKKTKKQKTKNKRKTKKYELLVGTKEEKEEYQRIGNNLDTCEKKCSQEKKIQNKQNAINGKILLTKKCNQDPKLNYKFDAYNQATWPFGDKYPTSPCIEEKQHLMNDPSFKYQKCMRHKCKNEREEFFKSRPTHANCVVS